jgi:hypothetical protein
MTRAKKSIALLAILAMLLAALMMGAGPALAFWWRPPPEEEVVNEEPVVPEEEVLPEEEVVSEEPVTTEAEATVEEPAASEEQAAIEVDYTQIGKIEALVWDDTITPDGTYSIEELVDGILVDLYKEETDGTWTLVSRKATGPGSFTPPIGYEHGWVGWDQLEVDPYATTRYKMELVFDDTYIPVNGATRYADLNMWNLHSAFFFPMAEAPFQPAPQIQTTTATIGGYVWWDANADQVRQWAEPAYADWEVVLTNSWGRRIATTKTDANGYYQFRGLKSSTYKVWVKKKRGFKLVYPYHKWITFEPWGCEEGHHKIKTQNGNYYMHNDFGFLDMSNTWAPLYYLLWQYGNIQYQFQ